MASYHSPADYCLPGHMAGGAYAEGGVAYAEAGAACAGAECAEAGST